ncbi:organic hydroperoxide resistance protein [Klebsiella quasipneumoniae]|uniref:organic hydroperoxide resistance protein n=1 Tax=Klebsiella pneumoniae complex TaxID=3390273 RepID=UPI0008769981|nr:MULTISPECIES: organic hydroperoxide resistance protein [Klebsiella]HBR1907188.1 organic hydroperoxide resistance protein [Klebsiella quasipneumoniae subsp. similipneumoniae]HCB0453862.1 organic hydroperoxide resistance protein [Klebsiella quasipneumoniae subsp. quasipneumoniae]EIX9251583.1 organic hydroperoxide resistance protein [Klebsiella pneumoniae]EIY5071483.1 organic hydroperoxide resistance protein [Klebsiella quasipneumoniae]EJC6287646.1 organic hydroperoxide resistance protein [Kle
MKIFYKTSATSVGGRDGRVDLDDGSFGLDLVSFTNDSGITGANPEQLFAMGYAACFDNALIHIAQQQKLEGISTKTSCAVGIGQNANGGFSLDIDLDVEVRGLDKTAAIELVKKGHEVCPYSNATRGNIDVRLHVSIVDKFDI